MECDHLYVFFRAEEFPKAKIKSETLSNSPKPTLGGVVVDKRVDG